MSAQEATIRREVWHLHGLRVPKTEIAKRVGRHRNTIKTWIDQMEADGGPTKEKALASEQAEGQSEQPGAELTATRAAEVTASAKPCATARREPT